MNQVERLLLSGQVHIAHSVSVRVCTENERLAPTDRCAAEVQGPHKHRHDHWSLPFFKLHSQAIPHPLKPSLTISGAFEKLVKISSVRLQRGLDACVVPCNAYDLGLKTHLHIGLDPIHPVLDISPPGSVVIQCENISDCYAQGPPVAEQAQSSSALASDSDGKFGTSIGLYRMDQLQRRHTALPQANLKEDRWHSSNDTNMAMNLARIRCI